MDKNTAAQNIPAAKPEPFPMMDAKRMSFDNASGSPPFEYKSSPPLSSFFGGRSLFKAEDPLTQMSSATRRDSLKGMHNLQDFSTD